MKPNEKDSAWRIYLLFSKECEYHMFGKGMRSCILITKIVVAKITIVDCSTFNLYNFKIATIWILYTLYWCIIVLYFQGLSKHKLKIKVTYQDFIYYDINVRFTLHISNNFLTQTPIHYGCFFIVIITRIIMMKFFVDEEQSIFVRHLSWEWPLYSITFLVWLGYLCLREPLTLTKNMSFIRALSHECAWMTLNLVHLWALVTLVMRHQ